MELFQRAQNPWGQEVLTHISWDLFWAAVIVGVLFMLGHLLFRRWMASRGTAHEKPTAGAGEERVVRHTMASRLFHWVMAASMLVLLFTGFLPQIGIQFAWVTIHWIAGLVLIASILYHIVHATFFQSLRNIWISGRDLKEFVQEMRHAATGAGPEPPKPPKYPVDHKMYHHAVTLTGFGAMITGVFMMFRVETPFWERDPYMFSDPTWGWIYVLHGLSGVVLVTLTMAHVYFAILPEKRWITRSMILGWISRGEYLAHHDAQKWPAEEVSPDESPAPVAGTESARTASGGGA